jgi:mono/diheme cytochrome c family protein
MQLNNTNNPLKNLLRLAFLLSAFFISACGGGEKEQGSTPPGVIAKENKTEESVDPMDNKGIGPIKSVTLGELDEAMALEGKEIYESLCTACHKIDKRYIGPSLQEVTSRRSPEWIMNMIMNPTEMVKEDPIARELLAEYISPMADQNITEDQARKILEYFRSINPNSN